MYNAYEDGMSDEPSLTRLWAQADKRATDWRDAGEVKLLEQMNDAFNGLKACGWKEAIYCPKDGTPFLAIEAGSTGVFRCYYEGEWPSGRWWTQAHGDLWPSRPILWKPLPTGEN